MHLATPKSNIGQVIQVLLSLIQSASLNLMASNSKMYKYRWQHLGITPPRVAQEICFWETISHLNSSNDFAPCDSSVERMLLSRQNRKLLLVHIFVA
jgi:hypothetical protein